MLKPLKVAAAILTTATVGALSGCVTNVEGGNPEGWEQITPAEVPEIAAMVPENVRQDGTFTIGANPVSYTHLTLPTIAAECRSRWSPYH